MEEALIARLNAVAAVAAAGAAVAWDERPRSDGAPSIVLTLVSEGRDYTHDGPDGLDFPWVQIDFWGADAAALVPLRDAVIAEFESATDVDGIRFHAGFLESSRSSAPETLDGGVTLHRRFIEVSFHWEAI
jgi:hypothetical protein